MEKLPKEVIEAFRDPETVKVLTTISEDGLSHTVFKESMNVLDDGTIAYAELIETSLTQRNMLRNFWFDKKLITISLFNKRLRAFYEIKGEPDRFVVEGPIWNQFLDEVWVMLPHADPSGVWVIIPKEVRDQRYETRRAEEEERRPYSTFWFKYYGKRP